MAGMLGWGWVVAPSTAKYQGFGEDRDGPFEEAKMSAEYDAFRL
jgi:hypothetical protein